MTAFTQDAVKQLSATLNEPDWMLQFRLKAFEIYESTAHAHHHG
jgi:Fe-S cluster assembly scaffold protein SufB